MAKSRRIILIYLTGKVFIETILAPLIERYPNLKVILEHITTKDSVEFIESQSSRVAGTITIHHLLYNRNDMLVGGIKPHLYCLPVLKRNIHQTSLIRAALGGNPKFSLELILLLTRDLRKKLAADVRRILSAGRYRAVCTIFC